MNLRAYRTFQALILVGLGVYLLIKVLDGRILLYIGQRFVVLVLLAALAMIILAQLVLRARPAPQAEETHDDHLAGHQHDDQRKGWVIWLVALPLLVGLLVPERPLGASALQSRGVNFTSGISARSSIGQAVGLPPAQRSVLDWIRVYEESEDPAALEGQPADVTGFVYHDVRLGKDKFMVGRFTIACCVADAMALGMIIDWPQSAELPDNQWVRVRGPVHAQVIDGKTVPSVRAEQVEIVPQPEQPYLFP